MATAIHSQLAQTIVNGLARRLTMKAGTFIKKGRLSVEFPDGSTATLGNSSDQLSANLKIHDEKFFQRVFHRSVNSLRYFRVGIFHQRLLELKIFSHRAHRETTVFLLYVFCALCGCICLFFSIFFNRYGGTISQYFN